MAVGGIDSLVAAIGVIIVPCTAVDRMTIDPRIPTIPRRWVFANQTEGGGGEQSIIGGDGAVCLGEGGWGGGALVAPQEVL